MCGFIAQLVEHRTGITEVMGSNPVDAFIFSGFFFPIAYVGKFTEMIILHFDLQPQFKYMNYFIYTSHHYHYYYGCSKTICMHSVIKRHRAQSVTCAHKRNLKGITI